VRIDLENDMGNNIANGFRGKLFINNLMLRIRYKCLTCESLKHGYVD